MTKSHSDRKLEKIDAQVQGLESRLRMLESFVSRFDTALKRFADARHIYDIAQDFDGHAEAQDD